MSELCEIRGGQTIVKKMIKKMVGVQLRKRRRQRNKVDPSFFKLGVYRNGIMTICGQGVDDIVNKFGSPVIVVNAEKLTENCTRVYDAFKNSFKKVGVFYSYKTNPVPGVLKLIHEHGIGAEVTSENELWLALKLKVPCDQIIYDGRCKSAQSLRWAIERGIKLINIDSFKEIEDIAEISRTVGRGADVGIRVVTGVGWKGQFGFSIETEEALEAIKRINGLSGLNFMGLHLHLGTGVRDIGTYSAALTRIFDFMEKAQGSNDVKFEILDIGGGFAVPTTETVSSWKRRLNEMFLVPFDTPELDGTDLDTASYAAEIKRKISELSLATGIEINEIFIEPGRIISSSAQSLVLTVADMKEGRESGKIAILDGGIGLAPPLFSEFREVYVANKMNAGNDKLFRLVGPTCNPADVLFNAVYLPDLKIGDWIAIMDAGAYFVPFSTSFCFPRPPVVLASPTGCEVVRKRETHDYIFSNDEVLAL